MELLEGNFINGSSIIARRGCIEAVGYFDETLMTDSDGDMWFKLLRAGCRLGRVPTPLTKYRRHLNNLSHRYQQHHLCTDAVRVRAIQTFSPADLFGRKRSAESGGVAAMYEEIALLLARQLLFRAACEAMERSLHSRPRFRGRLLKCLFRTMSSTLLLAPLLSLRQAYNRFRVRDDIRLQR
jgi:hypothetical protein